jgi:hypothetical protein
VSIRRRICLVVLAILLLLAFSPISPLYWALAHVYYEPARREARQFCESLVPAIEAGRQEDGSYPSTPDPAWLRGKKIPRLIRPKNFYESKNYSYTLYFWDPGTFWDNFWSFNGESKTWANMDANLPQD